MHLRILESTNSTAMTPTEVYAHMQTLAAADSAGISLPSVVGNVVAVVQEEVHVEVQPAAEEPAQGQGADAVTDAPPTSASPQPMPPDGKTADKPAAGGLGVVGTSIILLAGSTLGGFLGGWMYKYFTRPPVRGYEKLPGT